MTESNQSKKFYVYIDLRQNKDVFYVGKGSGDRFYRPLRKANKHWMAIVKKEKGYARHIVKSKLTEQEAFDLEIKLISKYKSTLVNFTKGGDGVSGHKHSIEARNRIRFKRALQVFSSSHRAKLATSAKRRFTGKKRSVESIEKQRLCLTGRKLPDQTKDRMKAAQIARRLKEKQNGI